MSTQINEETVKTFVHIIVVFFGVIINEETVKTVVHIIVVFFGVIFGVKAVEHVLDAVIVIREVVQTRSRCIGAEVPFAFTVKL